jgi:predicted P-loop ATPase
MDSTPATGSAPEQKHVLHANHVEILTARGIPADFAVSHGLQSIDCTKLKEHRLKYKKKGQFPGLPLHDGATGILIPYQTALDGIPRCRIRVDRTEVTLPGPIDGSHHGEHTVTIPRYVCQSNVSVAPYLTPEVSAIAGDTSKPVFIVEAPLKALSLAATGFPAIGLGGVLAGATEREVLDTLDEIVLSKDMQTIKWTGRTAYVVFDAGIHDNPMVALGASRLSLALLREGADVRLVQLPYYHPAESEPENGKVYFKTDQGPDDYLVREGIEAFQRIVEAAVPADVLARVSMAAAGANRTEAIARLLGELSVQAVLHEGGSVLIDQVVAATKAVGIGKKAVTDAVKAFAERLTRKANASAAEWKKRIRRTAGGSVMGTVANALLVLEHDERVRDSLGYDQLREEPAWLRPPPWASSSGQAERPVTDDDATRLVAWLDEHHDVRIAIPIAHAVIESRARARPFHRVREYLAGVRHDGVERVAGRQGPGWLTSHLGVPDSRYVRAVGRLFLIAAVARVREPGCKLDTMLVLEGAQGKCKSTSVEVLFGADYFSDQLSEVTTKDASSDLRGKWVIEWSELDNLSRAESSTVKKYISRKVDDYRPSYGRRNVRIPRQCVFVGTVNKNQYLKDETGNRRFLPVECVGEIDIDALRRDRDQLWAEAVALYAAHEKWWFASDEPDLIDAARDEQDARRVADPWEAVVAAALDEGDDVTTDDEMNIIRTRRGALNEVTTAFILDTVLSIPKAQQNRPLQMRVGEVMHALGWSRRQRWVGTRREWVYERPVDVPASGVTTITTITGTSRGSEPDPDSQNDRQPPQDRNSGGDGSDGGDQACFQPANDITTFPDVAPEGGDGGDRVSPGGPPDARPPARDDEQLDDDDDECRQRGMRLAGVRGGDA